MSTNRRILLIDDSPLVVDALRDELEEDGVEVEGVADLAAIDAQELERFDLILIDVLMPAMFGDDVAMVMRRGHNVATPIVLLSSLPDPELAARAREAGADGFISKRSGIDAVVAEIRTWLAGGRQRRQEEV
ncbi:MAG TPA: response regulator [Kofleriaceae bacterium]|nr:response regulator [Kofleriaceae bacterium]